MSELGELLLEVCHQLVIEGRLSEKDLEQVLKIQKTERGNLDEILVGTGILSEEAFQRGLAESLGVRFWEADALQKLIEESNIPEGGVFETSFLHEHILLPVTIDREESLLHVIVSRMPSRRFLRHLEKLSKTSQIKFDFATRSVIAAAIYQIYEPRRVGASVRAFGTEAAPSKESAGIHCPECGMVGPVDHLVCDDCGAPLREELKGSFLQSGTLVGSFQIERLVACGGMAEVYRAIDMRTDQEAALKVLQSQLSSMRSAIQRFQREAKTLRELRHPGIVRFFEFGFQEGVGLYIATEFLRGREFLELLQEERSVPLEMLKPMVAQICDALSYAHEHEVIHRDLKPDNIFLTEDGESGANHVKLIDFGIAKILDDSMVRTQTGLVLGTPRYMSPEQVSNQELDYRSDIYSLAVIVFEALTNRCLFEADGGYQMMLRQLYTVPPTISEMRPDLGFPPKLVSLIAQSLSKEPEDRPQSMSEFKEIFLEAIEEGILGLPELEDPGDSTILEATSFPAQEESPFLVVQSNQHEGATLPGLLTASQLKNLPMSKETINVQVDVVEIEALLSGSKKEQSQSLPARRPAVATGSTASEGEIAFDHMFDEAFGVGSESSEPTMMASSEHLLRGDDPFLSSAAPESLSPKNNPPTISPKSFLGDDGDDLLNDLMDEDGDLEFRLEEEDSSGPSLFSYGVGVEEALSGTEVFLESESQDDLDLEPTAFHSVEDIGPPPAHFQQNQLDILGNDEQFSAWEAEAAREKAAQVAEVGSEDSFQRQSEPSLVLEPIPRLQKESAVLGKVDLRQTVSDPPASPDSERMTGLAALDQVKLQDSGRKNPPVARPHSQESRRRESLPRTPGVEEPSSGRILGIVSLVVLCLGMLGGMAYGVWLFFFQPADNGKTEPLVGFVRKVKKAVAVRRSERPPDVEPGAQPPVQTKKGGYWEDQYRPDWQWDPNKRKFVMIRKWMKIWVPNSAKKAPNKVGTPEKSRKTRKTRKTRKRRKRRRRRKTRKLRRTRKTRSRF